MSFQQILREKMGHFPSENKEKSATSEPHLKHASSTEIHEKIDFETVFFATKKYSRSASLMSKKIEKASKTPSKEVIFAVESLSKEAFFSLEMMKRLGAVELNSKEISLSQVKKAFRRLCLIYHPDHQDLGSSPREIANKSLFFSQLTSAKDELEQFFTSSPHTQKSN